MMFVLHHYMGFVWLIVKTILPVRQEDGRNPVGKGEWVDTVYPLMSLLCNLTDQHRIHLI